MNDEDRWFGIFQGYRPRGDCVEEVFAGVPDAPEKAARLRLDCRAAFHPDWTRDAYFVVRTPGRRQSTDEDNLANDCDPNAKNVADLMGVVRAFFQADPEIVEAAVQIPFEKLTALMTQGNWSFVGGSFMEFEGHHNDTEITVFPEPNSSA